MDEARRKLIEEALKHADPEVVAKFGNPLNEDDPRMWTPTQRQEAGMSDAERLRLLELDYEAQALVIANIMQMLMQTREAVEYFMKKELLEAVQRDPERVTKALLEGLSSNKGSYGPLDNDSEDTPIRYAGSAKGAHADTLIETPDGLIRMAEIPGYVNDPNWTPSPDWMDANCMCDAHRAKRDAGNDWRPGNYL